MVTEGTDMHFLIELYPQVQLNIGQMVTLEMDIHFIPIGFQESHNTGHIVTNVWINGNARYMHTLHSILTGLHPSISC